MEKINKINNLVSDFKKTNGAGVIFPFALLGFVFLVFVYIVLGLYLMVDFVRKELHKILKSEIDNASNGVQIVKYWFGFPYVMLFYFVSVIVGLLLICFYLITAASFYVSSCGAFKPELQLFDNITME